MESFDPPEFPPPGAPRQVLEFRRPRAAIRPGFQLLGLAVFCLGGAAFAVNAAFSGSLPEVLPWWLWGLVGVAGGGLLALYLGRGLRIPARLEPLVLDGRVLTLPLGPASDKTEQMNIDAVEAVELILPRRQGGRLVIETDGGAFLYPLPSFERPAEVVEFARTLVQRISQLPDGHARIAKMERRREVVRRIWGRQPRTTRSLLFLIVGMFVLQHFAGAFDGGFEAQQSAMLRLGANAPYLVGEGQWWRLFTANFLHGGTLHIGLNGLALWSLGSLLERLVGAPRFLLVYLGSALAGSLASAWAAQGPFSVGASTAIFGLLGAFGVLSLRFGRELPAGIRQTKRWWIFILGVNAALPLVVPVIDVAAHAGGFVAGAAILFLAYPTVKHFDPWARPSIGILAAAGAMSVVFMYAGLRGAEYAAFPDEPPMDTFMSVLAANEHPEMQNMHAWLTITRTTETSSAALRSARDRAQRVVERKRVSSYLDTLATAEYRLANFDRAANLEREALVRARQDSPADDAILWSQLARFLRARPSPDPRVDGSIDPSQVSVRLAGSSVVVDGPERPLVVFAELRRGSRSVGLMRVGLEPGSERRIPVTQAGLRSAIAGQVELHILWIDAPERLASGEAGLDFRAHDPEVDKFP